MISSGEFALQPLFVALLVSVRIGALFLINPVISALELSMQMRILLIVVLSLVLTEGMDTSSAEVWKAVLEHGVFSSVLVELAVGAIMCFGIQIAFAAIEIGGRMLDIQIGYGMAQVYDPALRRQSPFLTSALTQFGLLIFFLTNGHHMMLRGLSYSLASVPPGHAWTIDAGMTPFLQHVGSVFSLGFLLVAPVMFCMLLLEFGLAMLARTVPQLHIFSFNHTAKIIVGVTTVALMLFMLPEAMGRIYRSVFVTWEKVFLDG